MDGELRGALLQLTVGCLMVGARAGLRAARPRQAGVEAAAAEPLACRNRGRVRRTDAMQEGEAAQQALFPYFAEWVLERYRQDIRAYR